MPEQTEPKGYIDESGFIDPKDFEGIKIPPSIETQHTPAVPEHTEGKAIDVILKLLYMRGVNDGVESIRLDKSVAEARQALYTLFEREAVPQKKLLEVEEPRLYQGVGGDSAPFYCSACQMSEMKIEIEGKKYTVAEIKKALGR